MSELARRAFGVTGEPIELPGGVSGVFRYGGVVLKPVTDIAEAAWEQATFAALAPRPDVRWARPIAAADGDWVVDGWIANEFITGLVPVAPDWGAVIAYGARFHAATQVVEPPIEILGARMHRWARGERHAFDEETVALSDDVAIVDTQFRDWCEPDTTNPQVVHVDLGGNVFLDSDHTPVILDIAPGYRSHAYAAAVVVADALTWSNASMDVVDAIGGLPQARPLLARALRFRLATDHLAFTGAGLTPDHLDRYRAVAHAMS